MTTFSRTFLTDTVELLEQLADASIETMVSVIRDTRERGGRLFFCGSGGGAGHASHAACDFRKLARVESYAVTDNVSELTARINDDGWETTFARWLQISHLCAQDAIMVFSVGGGSRSRGVSMSLVMAIELAHETGASIYGIVGSRDGSLAQFADAAVIVEPPADLKTPLVESFQAVVWHALVSHPALAAQQAHWESITSTDGAMTSI